MAEPHTDTDHDSGAALAITLVGLFVILAIFASPWVFSDAWWNNGWRQEQVPMGLPVEEPKAGLPVGPPQARLPTANEDEIDSSDPPPYAFVRVMRTLRSAPQTPDLSKLCVVPS